jgi:hypothetical protein
MYGAVIRAAQRWNRIKITEFEQCQLDAVRQEFHADFAARFAPAAGRNVAESPTRFPAKT